MFVSSGRVPAVVLAKVSQGGGSCTGYFVASA
jgi:hypothetical protein